MRGLILGNCVDRLGDLSPSSVDLTVTSPPYGSLRPQYQPLSWDDFEVVASELWRVTKEGGIVCWQEGDQVIKGSYSLLSCRHAIAFHDLGFRIHDVIITGTAGHRYPSSRRYKRPLTHVFVLSKGKPTTVNLLRDRPNKSVGLKFRHNERMPDGSTQTRRTTYTVQPFGVRGTVWIYKRHGHCAERYIEEVFPALMHERLAGDLISSYSKESDVVLDPFAGACTTGKVAALKYRDFVGFENAAEFYELGIRRYESAMVAARHARYEELASRLGINYQS